MMAPVKKGSSSSASTSTASKRSQGGVALQPTRYGIQHFFARHSSQSATPQASAPPQRLLTRLLPTHTIHPPSMPAAAAASTPATETPGQATQTQYPSAVCVQSTDTPPNKRNEQLKRRRLSLGMVVPQSQDDGGDEVVWKVSPTSERLLSAGATESTNYKKERFALHPCQTMEKKIVGRSQDVAQNSSNGLNDYQGVSTHFKASPGMAGKLEHWLSFGGDLLCNGSKSSSNLPSILPDANKENSEPWNLSPIVTDTNSQPIKISKSIKRSWFPLTKMSRRSVVAGNFSKKSIPKQAKSGERRKALLQLLDQVQDAVSSEKSNSELPADESLASCLAEEVDSDLAKASGAQQHVAEDCQSFKHAPNNMEVPTLHDNSNLNKGDQNGEKIGLESAEKVHTLEESLTTSMPSPSYLMLPGDSSPSQHVSLEQHSVCMAKIACCTVQKKGANQHAELLALEPMLNSKTENEHLPGKMCQHFDNIQAIKDTSQTVGASHHPRTYMKKNLHNWSEMYFLVLEVSEGAYSTEPNSSCFSQKILQLLNEQNGIERIVKLRDEWVYTMVRPGDTVNIIGEFDMDGVAVVDHDKNFLIVNPDILISGSRVGASYSCPRRAVLDERITSNDLSSHALMGTLLHQLFQAGLRMEEPKHASLEHEASVIVQRHIDSLYAITGDERDVYLKLVEAIPTILDWMHRFRSSVPSLESQVDFGWTEGQQQLLVTQVLDIEETIWSPKFGIKGMIDASLKIKGNSTASGKSHVMPFELKTGKASSGKAAMEHKAQVMLYTLLMSDRYAEEVKAGLLFYLHTNQTQGISAQRGELAGLLIRRNEHASNILAASSSQILPSMLQNLHICQGCRLLDICSVYHKGQGGTSESSGLGKLFDTQTSHLNKNHHEFLQHWDHLIDLESHGVYASQSEIWRLPSSSREEQGRCLSSMMLDISSGYSGDSESLNGRFMYCFRRMLPESQLDAAGLKVDDGVSVTARFLSSLQDRPFSCGDYVLLSTESGHVAVAAGYIVSINANSVMISFSRRLRLPGNSTNAETVRLLQEVWRIDKDEIKSSWSIMRYNLLQLFVKNGDEQRRRLIVDLEEPKFDTGGLISQDPAIIYARSLPGVNDDQRRAILKILAARDYALILGMPGTGKTSTIVLAVQALCARGASVLLASYTNSAVDNILLKLKLQDIDFIRIGRLEAVHPELQEHVIGGSGSHTTSVRQLREKVEQAQVVGCTCLGITHAVFRNRKFDVCIIDEAGQITLPVTIGPLRYAKTFVLVGDHYQLPPLVRNPEARGKGMSISLFRRLSEAHPQAVSALHYQYRMCSDIMALCNTLIYGHRLRCGSVEVSNAKLEVAYDLSCAPQWLQQVVDAKNRVIFLNTDYIPAHEQHVQHAVKNSIEASILLKIVKSLVTGGVPAQSIGVISPYNAQVDIIQKISMENGVSGLEVHTVDKYQGRDKDCVMISFVRSNEQHRSSGSLLADWHRVNVAITRAKKKLIMIGSQKTLSSIPLLKVLIDEVKNVGVLVNLPREANIHPIQRCSSLPAA